MSRRDLVRDTDSFRWMLYDVDATSLNEMSPASPAVAGTSVFIRTATKLYRISKSVR